MFIHWRSLTLLLFLASCTGLSQSDCLDGDWRGIGQRDGLAGYGPSRLAEHADSCRSHGVIPDAQAWEQGRQEGIRQYCTPQNAYQLGRKGRPIGALCTTGDRTRMAEAYAHGLKYHEISREISHLEQVILMNRVDIREILGATNGASTIEVMMAQSENFRLEARIRQLEHERRAYATWP